MRLNLPKQKVFTGPALVWKRMLAFLIDIIILEFIVFSPFSSLMQQIFGGGKFSLSKYSYIAGSPEKMQAMILIALFATLLALIYFSVIEYKLNQTPGKIIMGIYIISSSRDLRYWQCLVRSLFIIPIFPFILLWVIDPIYALFNKDNQRLFELLSKTKVVERFIGL